MPERKKGPRDPLVVPIPKRGTAGQRDGDRVYVYHIIRSMRNEKNQPTSERVCIGRLSNDKTKLITNATFDELYYEENGHWLRVDGKFEEDLKK